MKKIYLVDVSSMFFRAFYAIRPLTSSQGVPVNAVYGFISMIVKLMREKKPDHMLFCYDRKEPSFRKDLYTDYKANRTEMPDDLQVQMPYLKKVADLFGIADIEVAGYEADDLIGTVAKQAAAEGYQVFIVSGDKDFSQLVNENIFLYDTMKEFVYTREAVKEKHGVWPEQFRDYLAITGDTSDHVPGVAGIGPKGAQKLIEQFGDLEKIYQNIDQVESKSIKEKLLKSKDQAFLSQKLVTIVTDVATGKNMDDFKMSGLKKEPLREFLRDLNFKSFEKTLLDDDSSGLFSGGSTAGISDSKSRADTEPTSTTALSLSENPDVSTVANVRALAWDQSTVLSRLKNEVFFAFLHQSEIHFGFENGDLYSASLAQAQFDFKKLKWSGYDLKKVWTELGLPLNLISQQEVKSDLMLKAYTLKAADSSDPIEVVKKFLQIELSDEARADEVYSALLKLDHYLNVELEKSSSFAVYEKIERPLIPLLYEMEKIGIKIDRPMLATFSKELGDDIKQCEEKIFEIAGEKFNVASPKQLGVILFEKMGLEVIKKTKTGYSTDNDVLEKLNHPIAQYLMDYRELAKLKSTYVDALPELVDQSDRLHTHLNQALTTTGRLSSTDPNLQNIPIRTEKGQRVRQAFIASEGQKLMSIDYSQIELRVLAHISDDAALIQAFKNDLDIHTATASEVFSVDLNAVTKDQRRIAKAVNFGIAYGQGAFGLAEALGISRTESKDIIERYFKKFKGIKDYIESTIEKANETKFVDTIFGRRRYLNELNSTNAMIKKFGERAAINAPIQGTASDLVKMAMNDVYGYIKQQREVFSQRNEVYSMNLLLQIHDELIFEGPEAVLRQESTVVKKLMENVARLKVPLKVNIAIGDNWDQAH